MKIKLLLALLIFQFPYAQSKIEDKETIMTIFDSCMSEQTSAISTGKMLEYCACYSNNISEGMDITEIMLLGMDLIAAGNDKAKAAQIALANEKIKKYLQECLTRLVP
jgi:hypothetical protein